MAAERCGMPLRTARNGPLSGKTCDCPKGHRGRHRSGRVAGNRKWSVAFGVLAKDPLHPYYWITRENAWARIGIKTLADGRFTRAEFWEMWMNQAGRCAMCGKLFGEEFETAVRKANVDHWHQHGKYGPARALLCWRCNRDVGDLTYERALVLWNYLRRFAPSTDGIDNASITLR